MIRRVVGLAAALAVSGCDLRPGPPAPVVDSYHAWLAGAPLEPVPSHFTLRELDGRWWFIAPSGRRFLAVSGATTPASGRAVKLDVEVPDPYLTAGIPVAPGERPVPLVLPGVPDPYDDAALPALTDAAQAAGVFADDPFCLGHLAIPASDLARLPAELEAPFPRPKAAERWFAVRTTGGTAASFRAEFAERLYGMMTSALRAADENHLIYTGWFDPGITPPEIAKTLGRLGDAVCARMPAHPDAVRMAGDAHAATGKPLLIWLTDPNARAGDPPDGKLRTIALELLALPYVVGVDTLLPPTAADAYRRHAKP